MTGDLTVAQCAEDANTTKHRVYEAIKSGTLRAYALTPKTTRIERSEWEKFKRSGGALVPPDVEPR